MGNVDELAKKTNSSLIPADATKIEDLESLIDQTMKLFDGKIDFVLHSIGMSVNVRKGKHYTDLNHDWTAKGWDVSAVSFHKLLQSLYKLDAMNEWSSIVALSYMAAQRVFPNYNDMADNKAYLESIARSFGYFFGKEKKVRVNTISQSPTPTTAGKGVTGFDGFISYVYFANYRNNINYNIDDLSHFKPYLDYITIKSINQSFGINEGFDYSLNFNLNRLKFIENNVFNTTIKNKLLRFIAYEYLLEEKLLINIDSFIHEFEKISSNTKTNNEIKELYTNIVALQVGKKIPSISLIERNGNIKEIGSIKNSKNIFTFWSYDQNAHQVNLFNKIQLYSKDNLDYNFYLININKDFDIIKNGKILKKVIGPLNEKSFMEIKDLIKPNQLILIKGSNGSKVWKLVKILQNLNQEKTNAA